MENIPIALQPAISLADKEVWNIFKTHAFCEHDARGMKFEPDSTSHVITLPNCAKQAAVQEEASAGSCPFFMWAQDYQDWGCACCSHRSGDHDTWDLYKTPGPSPDPPMP